MNDPIPELFREKIDLLDQYPDEIPLYRKTIPPAITGVIFWGNILYRWNYQDGIVSITDDIESVFEIPSESILNKHDWFNDAYITHKKSYTSYRRLPLDQSRAMSEQEANQFLLTLLLDILQIDSQEMSANNEEIWAVNQPHYLVTNYSESSYGSDSDWCISSYEQRMLRKSQALESSDIRLSEEVEFVDREKPKFCYGEELEFYDEHHIFQIDYVDGSSALNPRRTCIYREYLVKSIMKRSSLNRLSRLSSHIHKPRNQPRMRKLEGFLGHTKVDQSPEDPKKKN